MSLLNRLAAERTRPDGTSRPNSQTERALLLISLLLLGGLVLIALISCLMGPGGARFFGFGELAALASLAAGAAVGLLFSLPTSARQVVVVAQSVSGSGNRNAAPAEASSGYMDNNTLQQIGSWLTTAIVALSLSQFDAVTKRFDGMAEEVSRAMTEDCSRRFSVLLLDYEGLAPPAGAEVRNGVRGRCPTEAAGGLIIAAFATLGFLLSYLWGRRYLTRELTSGQREGDDAARAKLGVQADTADLVPPSSVPAKRAAAAAAAFVPSTPPAAGFPPAPGPSEDPNDPWKGAFGGLSASSVAELTATVVPTPDESGQFLIDLRVRGADAAQCRMLAGREARVFLHPTYPRYVRLARFDGNGEVRMALRAYGAFTVGVQLQDGTLLELDLANLPGAPAPFKSR